MGRLKIGSAFDQEIIFGITFLAGGIYVFYNGDFLKMPALPVNLFAGGSIARIATKEYFLSIFKSQNLFDLIITILIFLLIYLIGQEVKKGDLEK